MRIPHGPANPCDIGRDRLKRGNSLSKGTHAIARQDNTRARTISGEGDILRSCTPVIDDETVDLAIVPFHKPDDAGIQSHAFFIHAFRLSVGTFKVWPSDE